MKTAGDYNWTRHSLRIHPYHHDGRIVAQDAEGIKVDRLRKALHFCAIARLDQFDRYEPKNIFANCPHRQLYSPRAALRYLAPTVIP